MVGSTSAVSRLGADRPCRNPSSYKVRPRIPSSLSPADPKEQDTSARSPRSSSMPRATSSSPPRKTRSSTSGTPPMGNDWGRSGAESGTGNIKAACGPSLVIVSNGRGLPRMDMLIWARVWCSSDAVSRFGSGGQYDEVVGCDDWEVPQDVGVPHRCEAGCVEVRGPRYQERGQL